MTWLNAKMIDLPPIWLLGALALATFEARLTGGAGDVSFGFLEMLGGLVFWLGLALIIGAVLQMLLHKTTPIPHQQPDKLVASGLFRLSRNPIYLGDLLVLTGCCLRWEAWLSLALVPILAIILTRRFILPEEARLAAKFGADFDAYRAQTRRWL